jgi:hypothetical protein
MTAIATNAFKKTLIESLINDVADSDNTYYLALGKADQWDENDTVPTTVNTVEEERKFRSNMQSIKKMADISFVSPRYNWSSGTTYNAFTDATAQSAIGAYYVMTESQRVYICLEQGKDALGVSVISTVNPDTIGTVTTATRTADGYIWKYLFTLTALNASKYLAANFLPVSKLTTSVSNIETAQLAVQNAAVAGSIVGYRLVSPGAGYTTGATASVVGNGTSAALDITVDAGTGSIIKVAVNGTGSSLSFGSGYTYADIVLSENVSDPAVIRPIISRAGIGADPRDDINASFSMFNAKPAGDEGGDFLVDQDFRQVGILKNPIGNADSDISLSTASALRTLTVTGVAGTFAADTLVRGAVSGAGAYVNKYSGNTLFVHQNETTGFKPFDTNEAIADSDNPTTNTATLSGSISDAEFNPFTGDLLYIENRNPVIRDAAQTEDIKIIFQL